MKIKLPTWMKYLMLRTPLGWRQLRHNPSRLAVALAGVAFANVLVFLQLGVMASLFESSARPVRLFNADIVLLSPEARIFGDSGSLPRRRMYQALGVEGVAGAAAVQIGTIAIRSPVSIQTASVLAFGVDPEFNGFSAADLNAQLWKLRTVDTALLDRQTRSSLAPYVEAVARRDITQAELAGRTISFVGAFTLGASFQNDGTMIASDQTIQSLLNRDGSTASLILLRTVPGANVELVVERLRKLLDNRDTQVKTLDGYAEYIKGFMRANSPIGFIFTFGTIVGLVIGFAIVYQILSADVNDHIAEYATFKAMGYSQNFLLGIVFEEALLLALLGFIPGIILSVAFYFVLSQGTELAITMPLDRAALVLGLTFFKCCLSGAVATRRLKAADPADVF